MKIGILVPDGVGVRNYLYSNVLKGIEHECLILHNFKAEAIDLIKKESGLIYDQVLPIYNEGIIEKFYREVIHKSRLKWNSKIDSNKTILKNYAPNRHKLKNKIFYFSVDLYSSMHKDINDILSLESKYTNQLRKNKNYKNYSHLLKKLKINVLFCTHQRSLISPILFLIARELNINTYAAIYSWDNLPKARLALRANNYLVWSEYMKYELLKYYNEINDNQIFVTGTPQFEFSFDPNNIIDKAIFYKKFNLHYNKKIICFSANDLNSPNEVLYLRDLVADIKKNDIYRKYQIIFRINPIDNSGRFNVFLSENKEFVKDVSSIWINTKKNDWTSNIPTKDDVKLLTSTCFYSDIVVNLASTMVFDFSVFNKPCVYINYNPSNLDFDVNTVYDFQHFRSMPSSDEVGWINSSNSFFTTIENILNTKKTNAKNWFNIISNHTELASKNIQNTLVNYVD
jgi:hypothetical protein